MLLSEIHSEVSSAIARGTRYDTSIPAWVRRAALWLERNYTLKYMERFQQVTVDITATYPRRITLPSTHLKKVHFVRYGDADNDSKFTYARQIDPIELNSIQSGLAKAFWLDGISHIVLSHTPDENYTYEIRWDSFTVWPTSDYSGESWLTTFGDDFLISQAIVAFAGPTLRDDKLVAHWRNTRDEALRTLLLADADMRESTQGSSMNYTEAVRAIDGYETVG